MPEDKEGTRLMISVPQKSIIKGGRSCGTCPDILICLVGPATAIRYYHQEGSRAGGLGIGLGISNILEK